MMRSNYAGWVKLPRNLLLTPVWASETAWRAFSWLLLSAVHCESRELVKGHRLCLQRGQIASTQLEIGRHTGLSRKSVQTALRLLENERVVMCDNTHGTHVTIYTVETSPLCQRGETTSSATGAIGRTNGRADSGQSSGQSFDRANPQSNSGISIVGHCTGSNSGAMTGTENGAETGASINNEEEVKKIRINPPTPFEKGGASDFYSLVLTMWRKENEAAGLGFCEDRPTRKGAALIAAEWLESGKVQPEQIRKAMAGIIREIRTNPKARLFNLRTLANSLSKYLDAPKVEKAAEKRMYWRWTCEKCGTDFVAMRPVGVEPPPAPCMRAKWGSCEGTAYPACEGEAG